MKKSYVKPQVYFENFQLSTNIAGECGTDRNYFGNHSSSGTCTWSDGYTTIFTSTNTGCHYTPDEAGHMCYDVAPSPERIFGS